LLEWWSTKLRRYGKMLKGQTLLIARGICQVRESLSRRGTKILASYRENKHDRVIQVLMAITDHQIVC